MAQQGLTITKNDRRVLQRLIRETPAKMDAALRGIATEMVGDIYVSFGTSPSPVGGPPGVDTNTLRGSIEWTPDGDQRIVIHDGTDYGVQLEFGLSRMGARPFMQPVFDDWQKGKAKRFLLDAGILK